MSQTATSETQTAIVTGGSRGLGLALVGALRARGWRVITDGRDGRALEEAARTTGAVAVAGDLADPDHRRRLVERAGPELHLLVNNAGILGPSPLPRLGDLSLDALRDVLEVNVVAQLGLVQAALPALRAAGGSVINISSDAAVEAYEGWGGYGASKAALEALSRVLAEEEPGLRVWSLDPGDMRTRMHQDAFPGEDISDRPEPATVLPALWQVIEARPPSGRIRLADIQPGAAVAGS